MKYGETLQQRSIPEWGHYNVDYDEIKHLIKEYTTPGSGKALAIPGQEDIAGQDFEDLLYDELVEQHARVNLFIRSKSGEIERRLDYLHDRLAALHSRQPPDAPARIPAKRVERYAKLEENIIKTGDEIRSLARFRGAQRTAFTKLLKKYKKWTGSDGLERRFKANFLDRPENFSKLDLEPLLEQYTEILQSVRAPFETEAQPKISQNISSTVQNLRTSIAPGELGSVSIPSRVFSVVSEGSEVDFDTALSTIPLGTYGSKAIYWVHPDHIVEVQVLLLQHTRLFQPSKTKSMPRTSPYATPLRRNSSGRLDSAVQSEKDDDIGLLVLDDPEEFTKKQNESTVGEKEATGKFIAKAAGCARWTSNGQAAVIVGLDPPTEMTKTGNLMIAKLKRKHLDVFLEPTRPLNARRLSHSSTVSENGAQLEDGASDAIAKVREWLVSHEKVKPIVGISSKRIRFSGLSNGHSGGLWATLDINIHMKKFVPDELSDLEWATKLRNDSYGFPHAVLEVRREGSQSTEAIQALDNNYLVERVRGFSLEAHAVWACCKPSTMSPPSWLPTLEKDIRKVPVEPTRRQRARTSSTAFSLPPTSGHTSASTASITDGQTSPSTLQMAESSATSGPEYLETSTLSAFKKKPKKSYRSPLPPKESDFEPTEQRYWNEYDHPEDGSDDEAYFIYIDPNATTSFPGQESLTKWAQKTFRLFRPGNPPERAPLLSPTTPTIPDSPTTDGDTSSDEAARSARYGYGTLLPGSLPEARGGGSGGYFSALFGALRNPHAEAQRLEAQRRQSERQMHSLISAMEARRRERESTKLRLYATCVAAAVVIDVILGTLTVTGRRKEKGVVDAGILFGTIASLLLCVVAVATVRSRHDRLGWVHRSVVVAVVLGVVAVDVLLLRWVVN